MVAAVLSHAALLLSMFAAREDIFSNLQLNARCQDPEVLAEATSHLSDQCAVRRNE